MRVFKRNAVIVTVLLFVAVAVYLNWSYNRGQDLELDSQVVAEGGVVESESEEAEGEETETLYFTEGPALSAAAISYFDSARLTREQARDSATTLLQEAAAIETASQEEIDGALGAITTMATFALQEAQLENILMAKDFAEVLVFIRNEGVSVIVSAPAAGLSDVDVARITDAVIAEVGVTSDQITIIPVN